jgi:hypothetical protein
VTASDDDMTESYRSQPPPPWGLCARCDHARPVPTDRGAVFVMCGRAAGDRRFVRYPVLPVRTCPGFEGDQPAPATAEGRPGGGTVE